MADANGALFLTCKMHLEATPIEQLENPLYEGAGVQVFIKREELNHQEVSGNKALKLKYNLLRAKEQGHNTLLTFGGAFSNHIYAVAAAGKAFGFKTIGIIRGEKHEPLNSTLKFATSCGMQLQYVTREDYRKKKEDPFIAELKDRWGKFYMIPEGGTNALAIKGVKEMVQSITTSYDYYCVAVGTGGTMAGVTLGAPGSAKVLGFSSLKGNFLTKELHYLFEQLNERPSTKWEVVNDYHFGGYAKVKPELISFMHSFEQRHKLLLDPVYTAKMMYGLHDKIKRGHFPEGASILAIHTGGLQGRAGFGL